MFDTVAVALIAVLGTLGSGLLSYLAARRSSEVQLAGVKTEMQKLRESHAEEHRRERQQAYKEFIDALQRIRQLSLGLTGLATDEAYLAVAAQYGEAHTNVSFLGEESVFKSLDRMLDIFQDFTTLVVEGDTSKSLQERLTDAFSQIADRWNEGEGALMEAMKYDIANARRAEEESL